MAYRAMTVFILACMFGGVAHSEDAAPTYKIVATVPLGSPERWDFVTYDPASKRAYVAHGDRVSVVDTVALKVVGTIAPLPGGSHGVAIAPENGIGFTDDGKAGTVAVFDPTSLKITSTLQAALAPRSHWCPAEVFQTPPLEAPRKSLTSGLPPRKHTLSEPV